MRSYRLLGGILTSLWLAPTALAHDYWFEREGDAYALYQGHLYSPHEGEPRVPYDPSIVQQSYCARGNGELTRLPASTTYPLKLKVGCAAFFVQSSSGYWTQTLTGTKNKPKNETFGGLRSWLSDESIKLIESWTPALAAPLTQGLELVPIGNPLTVAAGDKVRLKATWKGQPKPGVTVAYQGDPRGVTDNDGAVNIRLRQAGAQVISASFEEALNDPKADKVVRATILQFQTK